MGERIKIVEVGPRDGLQNEGVTLSVLDRTQFIQDLIDCGIQFLEAGSFVSPNAIPQMLDSEKVWENLKSQSGVDLSFLVPNQRGFERALEVGVKSIAVFTATSETFVQKNIGMSVDKSLRIFKEIVKEARAKKLRVRGYISTAFGCPYEGVQKPGAVQKLAEELLNFGCQEISIGDTIGVAHPRQVKEVFKCLQNSVGLEKTAGHFHDTRGMALVNILTALELGVRGFDSSVGGLGGCPYAQGSSGNVATEEVAWLMEGYGFHTGISIEGLLKVAEWAETKVRRPLKAKFYLSKPKRLHYDR